MGVIIFNGKSSTDYGIVIEKRPPQNHGAKRGEAYTIAGRNGTFFREDGTYDNYIQPYEVAIRQGLTRRADLRAADVAGWLLGSSGFCRLEDGFEPEFYRMARYAGPLNIEQVLNAWGRCTLEFDCLPERWLRSGEEAIVGTDAAPTLFNPTPFKAKPVIKLYGSASLLSVTVNNVHYVDVPGAGSSGPVTIDCETGTIEDATGLSLMGSCIFYGDYNELPELAPGENTLTFANASSYEIVPRWWTL